MPIGANTRVVIPPKSRMNQLLRGLHLGDPIVRPHRVPDLAAKEAALAWAARTVPSFIVSDPPELTDDEHRKFCDAFEQSSDRFLAESSSLSPLGLADLFVAQETFARPRGVKVESRFVRVGKLDWKRTRMTTRMGEPIPGSPRAHLTTFTPESFTRDATAASRPLLILHGLGENGPVNYALQAADFAASQSTAVHVLSWLGHGESNTLHLPTFAEGPSDYTEVLEAAFGELVRLHPNGGWRIMAHSMGGAALLTYFADHPINRYNLDFISHMVFIAPMLGLRGLGAFSQWLYLFHLLPLFVKDEMGPLGFPIEDLTSNGDEATRIRCRATAGVSDFQSASNTRWIIAANQMMEAVRRLDPARFAQWKGHISLFIAPETDKITNGTTARREIRRLFPRSLIRDCDLPHRLHTDPQIWREIVERLTTDGRNRSDDNDGIDFGWPPEGDSEGDEDR